MRKNLCVRLCHAVFWLVLWPVLVCATGASATEPGPAPRPVTFRTQTMGTWASLTLVTTDSASVAGLAYRALVTLHRVDSLMSNWTSDSEVARINGEASHMEVVVHPEVSAVIAYGQQVAVESGGAFDLTIEPLVRLWGFLGGPPRVPSEREVETILDYVGYERLRFDADRRTLHFTRDGVRIDLGGIAKGYGVDVASDVLRREGPINGLLDLSGNMVALGNAAGKEGWTVGVRDPSGKHDYLARLRLFDEAVATSGDYEQFVDDDGTRYGHILDPRTGYSARGLSSVTIVSDRAMAADAWATALFVLGGEEARRIAASRRDLSVVLIEPDGDGSTIIWVEESLRPHFQLVEELSASVTVRYF